MHPLIPAYLAWRNLYVLVILGGRRDLDQQRRQAWEFFSQLRGDAPILT